MSAKLAPVRESGPGGDLRKGTLNPCLPELFGLLDAAGDDVPVRRIAIVGGFVYRGSDVSALVGRYICADLNGFLLEANLETGILS